ncbi:spore germination protein KC [Paenibacillus amylolyticus]|uniref:Spore germination protein KC n=1 Tax=Paenibacillus amylolyticus TaxID=1451 RepID=A0AAP5H5K4_PAEAM|nr:Ger(x)C family spore germination protein [Paenibacillus amylolyticus]MDR6724469.1 spore germination protein KC [Paenibacillus amylolyticus]
MIIKKIYLLGCISLLLSGCWNRTELNQIGITSATGFDRSGNDWVATYQVIVPSSITSNTGGGSGSSQPAVNVFSSVGKTISEAANLSNLENPRRLYFAHNNVVVIGKDAMDQGINQLIDTYLRTSESRETVWLLVSDQNAGTILRKLIPPEKIPGESIDQILRKEADTSSIFPPITIFDYASKMKSDAKAIGIPIIMVSGKGYTENDKLLDTMDTYKKVSQAKKLRITELAIIQNGRLVGRMNQHESRGLSWITNKVKGTVISISTSEHKHKELVALTILNSKTKQRLVKSGDHYVMNIYVKAKANISESESKLNLSKDTMVKQVEDQAGKDIKEEITASWKIMQRLGTDLGGYADTVHRKYPKHWQEIKDNWNHEFKKMELNIHVKVIIKRPGMLQNSFSNLD